MRTLPASEFKARCLAILDEVQRTGEPVTVLKRGKPVAVLAPVPPARYPQDELLGTVAILGDVLAPAVDEVDLRLEADTLERPA